MSLRPGGRGRRAQRRTGEGKSTERKPWSKQRGSDPGGTEIHAHRLIQLCCTTDKRREAEGQGRGRKDENDGERMRAIYDLKERLQQGDEERAKGRNGNKATAREYDEWRWRSQWSPCKREAAGDSHGKDERQRNRQDHSELEGGLADLVKDSWGFDRDEIQGNTTEWDDSQAGTRCTSQGGRGKESNPPIRRKEK